MNTVPEAGTPDSQTPDTGSPDTGSSAASTSEERSESKLRAILKVAVPPTLVAIVIIIIWYGVTYLILDGDRRFLLPPPHGVVGQGFLNTETLGEILEGLYQTTLVAAIGLTIAFALGFSLSLVMSQAKWIERSLYPWAVVSQTVPILALVPLLGFWFGFGVMSRVTVCVIIALFPIIINSLTGLQSADPRLHDLLTLHNASRWTRATKLQIPAARPYIFTGLRTSAGLAVIGAIVGDFFFGRGQPGLGMLLDRYSRRLQSEELLAAVVAACVLGVVAFWIFGVLGRRMVGHWDPSWADERHH